MENIKSMKARHEREIEELQEFCKHKKTERMPYMWAPGHYGNDVEVCKRCGKVVKAYPPETTTTATDFGDYTIWSLSHWWL
jgi:hypothetical protein